MKTSKEFLDYFESRTQDLYQLAAKAQKEYVHPVIVFANFDKLADDLDTDRKKILFIYMKKHLDAIRNFINDPNCLVREPILGRTGDVIVYLLLLEFMVVDDLSNVAPVPIDNSYLSITNPQRTK